MPITPPSSRIVFVAPEAWPASSGRTDVEHRVGRRGEDEPHAGAAEDERRDQRRVRDVDLGDDRQPARPRRACSASPSAISGREPMRSESSPAIGATNIGIAVHGSVRSPDSSGE